MLRKRPSLEIYARVYREQMFLVAKSTDKKHRLLFFENSALFFSLPKMSDLVDVKRVNRFRLYFFLAQTIFLVLVISTE